MHSWTKTRGRPHERVQVGRAALGRCQGKWFKQFEAESKKEEERHEQVLPVC